MMFTIYVKTKAMKQWRPLGRDRPVINLLCAVMYDDIEKAKQDLTSLRLLNPGVAFEIRNGKGNRVSEKKWAAEAETEAVNG